MLRKTLLLPSRQTARRVAARLLLSAVTGAACAAGAAPATQTAAATPQAPIRLRIVGGLATVNQYTRHEKPFWTRVVSNRTQGRVVADIVPFDQAGIRGPDVLQLMEMGIVPFGTLPLGATSAETPEWGATDLAGLTRDVNTMRQVVRAFRPHLARTLKEHHGLELLAVYAYPAQVLFCRDAFSALADITGRRVRTSTPSQSDFVEALGGVPVRTAFASLMANMATKNTDCAITGTMSGNTIGLHRVTSHIHTMPITWGLSLFSAHSKSWEALPLDVRSLLQEELLPKLEADIWEEAERETREGVECNTGKPSCLLGEKGDLTAVQPTPADEQKRREIFVSTVLPRWVKRCGDSCVDTWNKNLKPVTGFEARPR